MISFKHLLILLILANPAIAGDGDLPQLIQVGDLNKNRQPDLAASAGVSFYSHSKTLGYIAAKYYGKKQDINYENRIQWFAINAELGFSDESPTPKTMRIEVVPMKYFISQSRLENSDEVGGLWGVQPLRTVYEKRIPLDVNSEEETLKLSLLTLDIIHSPLTLINENSDRETSLVKLGYNVAIDLWNFGFVKYRDESGMSEKINKDSGGSFHLEGEVLIANLLHISSGFDGNLDYMYGKDLKKYNGNKYKNYDVQYRSSDFWTQATVRLTHQLSVFAAMRSTQARIVPKKELNYIPKLNPTKTKHDSLWTFGLSYAF